MIEGTFVSEAGERGRSCGEAGIHHLTAPLSDVRFHSIERAREFAKALLTEAHVLNCPVIKVNNRLGRRTYGRYFYNHRLGRALVEGGDKPMIELSPRLELHTLVHELAHHVAWTVHGGRGHGAEFKRVLAELATATLAKLGREPEAPAPRREYRPLPTAGTEVLVDDGRGTVFLGTVLPSRGTRYAKVQAEDGRIFRVPASLMEY